MQKIPLMLTLLVTACLWTLPADLARAQSTRVFVAAQGSDANPCTFASPCRTFQRAHNAVAAGGEIDVLDPAGYGALTITKSISIQGHGFSGMTVVSGGTGIIISAGATDSVSLNGLLIDGAGTGQTGIQFNSGRFLIIANSYIRALTQSGIALAPGGHSDIAVSNTVVADTGSSGWSSIYVQPVGHVTTRVTFSRVESHGSGNHGIAVFGHLTDNSVDVIAVDCVVDYHAGAGFFAISSDTYSNVDLKVFRPISAFNTGSGIRSENLAFVTVSETALQNGNDWLQGSGGGAVRSYGNNTASSPPPGGVLPLR